MGPWLATPRYTFAAVDQLPDPVVVAHGEPISLAVHLAQQTITKPREGFAQVESVSSRSPQRWREGGYKFDMPPQIAPAALQLPIGDWRQRVRIEPMARPELTSVIAEISLPEYLGLPKMQTKDVRGGTLSPVNGSQVRFVATASRELASSQIDGQRRTPTGNTAASPPIRVQGHRQGRVPLAGPTSA